MFRARKGALNTGAAFADAASAVGGLGITRLAAGRGVVFWAFLRAGWKLGEYVGTGVIGSSPTGGAFLAPSTL